MARIEMTLGFGLTVGKLVLSVASTRVRTLDQFRHI